MLRAYPILSVFSLACKSLAGFAFVGVVVLSYLIALDSPILGAVIFITGTFQAIALAAIGEGVGMLVHMAHDTRVSSEQLIRLCNRRKKG